MYVSFDDGGSWRPLKLNLPAVPISDLLVKDNDLVVATNGRSFWILDDLAVLRQAGDGVASGKLHLFEPAPAYRFTPPLNSGGTAGVSKSYTLGLGNACAYYDREEPDGEKVRVMLDAGANPPDGVVVHYFLGEVPEGETTLTFLDAGGQEIKRFSSVRPAGKAAPGRTATGEKKRVDPVVRVEAGMNRFVWDMRYPDARQVDVEDATDHGIAGPLAPPDRYQVRLTAGEESRAQQFEIRADPRIDATDDDLRAQFDLLIRVRDTVSEASDAVNQIVAIRKQVDEWVRRAAPGDTQAALTEAADALKGRLTPIEDELVQWATIGGLNRISHPARLTGKIREVGYVPAGADYAPTQPSIEVFEELSGRLEAQFRALRAVIDSDLPAFLEVVSELGIPAIKP